MDFKDYYQTLGIAKTASDKVWFAPETRYLLRDIDRATSMDER